MMHYESVNGIFITVAHLFDDDRHHLDRIEYAVNIEVALRTDPRPS